MKPLGEHGSSHEHTYLRVGNKVVLKLVGFLDFYLQTGRYFFLVHPCDSWLWQLPAVVGLLAKVSVQKIRIGGPHGAFVVFDSIRFNEQVHCEPRWAIEWKVAVAIIPLCKALIAVWEGTLFSGDVQAQVSWNFQGLVEGTRGLAKGGVSLLACKEVMELLKSMTLGNEIRHLHLLHSQLDTRGSDIRVETGEILRGGRQLAPYPAVAWDWRLFQSYRWQVPQHINVLELLACFNSLTAWSSSPTVFGTFIF